MRHLPHIKQLVAGSLKSSGFQPLSSESGPHQEQIGHLILTIVTDLLIQYLIILTTEWDRFM